ncbi:hypothetical protein CP533_3041 [Ophiocordyceps camponoti-saundersi (nom. inval.)]|nr:hypothetical protein CP533_3041 [Ophiocordyceps camponoti-saundersi (nom. inval.)]
MSLNLKHLPCPAGSSCKAFQCIFGHPQDEKKSKSRPAEEAPSDDGPRKRPRLDERENLRPETFNAAGDSSKKAKGSQAEYKHEEPAIRPVSSLATTAMTTHERKPAARCLKSRTTSQSKKVPTADKRESLNPRLIKKSPADHGIRHKLLTLLHREYSRLNSELRKEVEKSGDKKEKDLILDDQTLITMALDEEEKTALEKPLVYTNVMKNLVTSRKRVTLKQWRNEREDALRATRPGYAKYEPQNPDSVLAPSQELELLQHFLTPIDDLSQYGYVSKVPSADSISAARESMRVSKGWEMCDRCGQRFQVFPGRREEDGALTSGGTCNFHWGKKQYSRSSDGFYTIPEYLCCGESVAASTGCHTHDHHVFKSGDPARLATVLNFAETPKNDLAPLDRAVCFDCEMGYTVYGMELIRLTATSWPTGEELLDVLVQPVGEILDLNSRFSGVWPDDMALAEPWGDDHIVPPIDDGLDKAADAEDDKDVESAKDKKKEKKKLKKVSSPEAARNLLFSLISPTTPLIGHAIENDLNSVRIVHPTIVDTVLLYPHSRGLPHRNKLKYLVADNLGREIQQETGPSVQGHDSAEDARAAGDLVRKKVNQRWSGMKYDGWTLDEEGIMQPPVRKEPKKDVAGS